MQKQPEARSTESLETLLTNTTTSCNAPRIEFSQSSDLPPFSSGRAENPYMGWDEEEFLGAELNSDQRASTGFPGLPAYLKNRADTARSTNHEAMDTQSSSGETSVLKSADSLSGMKRKRILRFFSQPDIAEGDDEGEYAPERGPVPTSFAADGGSTLQSSSQLPASDEAEGGQELHTWLEELCEQYEFEQAGKEVVASGSPPEVTADLESGVTFQHDGTVDQHLRSEGEIAYHQLGSDMIKAESEPDNKELPVGDAPSVKSGGSAGNVDDVEE